MNESDKNLSEVDGIALDMDGLLFDTERLYWDVGDVLLQSRGHRYSRELQQRMMGRVGVAAIQQMIDFHDLDDNPEDLLAQSDALFEQMLADDIQPMKGLQQWIDFLMEQKVPFGLATSSRRKFVDVIFENVGWRDELAFVLTGDDVTRGKPDPQMYQFAAEKLAIPAQRMLVLEDSQNGCAAAVAAGAITVAIPNEHTSDQNFPGVRLVANSLIDSRLWKLLARD